MVATKPTLKQVPTRTQLDIFLGKAEKAIGRLVIEHAEA